MCYNPFEIINYLKCKLSNETNLQIEFKPYYEGFNGTIEMINPSKCLIKGIYEKIGPDKIRVTELPVGFWTDDFKEHLESLIENTDKNGKKTIPIVKDYDDMSKDTTVDFIITLQKGKLDELEAQEMDYNCNGIFKTFKLYTTNTTTNMHLFDAKDKLKKYDTIPQIIEDYFITRLELYDTRKQYLINSLEKELVVLSNKTRYIKENIDGSIDLRNKKKETVIQLLNEKGFHAIDEDTEFKYLIKMTMDSVTEENVNKLFNDHKNKEMELFNIKNTSIHQMWLNELEILEKEYNIYKRERTTSVITSSKKVIVKKIIKK
jgi:DNA topoisomerase-2